MHPIHLTSLRDHYRALVFGASGGVGAAIVDALLQDARCGVVYAAARHPRPLAPVAPGAAPVVSCTFDLEDEASIANVVAQAASDGPLDFVIVATGLLHDAGMKPEKTWRALDADVLARAFRINTIGPALIARYALPHLSRDQKAVFAALSARVGSIEDNRLGGWHAYRSSKAALNMMLRNLAIELARQRPQAICVGLHPGTVDTGLSKPFQAGVAEDRLFSPAHSAACLLSVIDRLAPADTGSVFAWDGSRIPF